ncbi:hypothetical protein SprV_0100308300 [Sparganum proliferum]
MKRLLLGIEPALRLRKSSELLKQLQSSEVYQRSRCLCIYLSLSDEPCTEAIIESALASGRRVCVPRLLPPDVAHERFPLTRHLGYMRMRAIRNLSDWTNWPLNKFGIREPPSPHSDVDLDDALSYNVDMLILPGLAFTKDGKRLGRGGGYYDRYLAGLRELLSPRMPFLLALAFEEQVLPELPTCLHDFTVDKVLYS